MSEENGHSNDEGVYDSDVLDLDGELSSTDSESGEPSPISNGINNEESNTEEMQNDEEMQVDDNHLNSEQPIEEKAEPSWTILGEQRFVEKKIISSAPLWAENPTTFDAKILSKKGSGIEHLEGLDPSLYEFLSSKISVWFPVQKSVLPKLLNPKDDVLHDIAISAPTGSGKTLCYLIPIMNQVLCGWKPKYIMSIVLAPTRTLIRQIANEFSRLNSCDAQIVVLSNGASYEAERKLLFPNGSTKAKAHIIISTPQRLVEHMIDRSGTINLKRLRYLVVDEADAMRFVREEWLGMLERASNYPPMHNINAGGDTEYNTKLQKILVSATLSLEADKLHDWNLHSPCLYRATTTKVVVEEDSKPLFNLPTSDVGRLTLPTGLTHEIRICEKQLKPLLIYCYLARNPAWRKVMVFVNTVDTSRRLTLLLTDLFKEERQIFELSSNTQGNRRVKTLKKLKEKAENFVVICSDTVGRGIDIDDIGAIFNYDVPRQAKTFVHRAGRAARAGNTGHAITLATKEEKVVFKSQLIAVDLWNGVVENRDKDKEFVKSYEKKYKNALKKLQEKMKNSKKK